MKQPKIQRSRAYFHDIANTKKFRGGSPFRPRPVLRTGIGGARRRSLGNHQKSNADEHFEHCSTTSRSKENFKDVRL
jgi:hypothetical protein